MVLFPIVDLLFEHIDPTLNFVDESARLWWKAFSRSILLIWELILLVTLLLQRTDEIISGVFESFNVTAFERTFAFQSRSSQGISSSKLSLSELSEWPETMASPIICPLACLSKVLHESWDQRFGQVMIQYTMR